MPSQLKQKIKQQKTKAMPSQLKQNKTTKNLTYVYIQPIW